MVGARKKATRARPNPCNRRHATDRNYARPGSRYRPSILAGVNAAPIGACRP
jgi:hypothetical protein